MTKAHKQLTAGELLNRLSTVALAADDDARVVFDFCGFAPSGFGSYRGYYEDLAIGYEKPEYPRVVRLRDFIQGLRGMIGQSIHGYKGGSYTVGDETAVWVANSGECEGTYVSGIDASCRWLVILKTKRDA